MESLVKKRINGQKWQRGSEEAGNTKQSNLKRSLKEVYVKCSCTDIVHFKDTAMKNLHK